MRKSRRIESNAPGETGGNGGADPSRTQGAAMLSGTDVGPDQRQQERAAQPKDDGDQEVLEARAGAVAGNRRRPEPPDETHGDDDGEIGLHGD